MRSIPELKNHPWVRRSIAILYGLFGWSMTVTGWAYLPWTNRPATLPDALIFSTQLFPVAVWGWCWMAAGWVTIVAACTQLHRKWFGASITGALFVHGLWWSFYAYAFFAGDDRSYVTSAIYFRAVLLLGIVVILISALRPKVTR